MTTKRNSTASEFISDAVHDLNSALRHSNAGAEVGAIVAIQIARNAIADAESALVSSLRSAGVSWETIGDTFHMTKQGAQQRFSTKGAAL